MTIPVFIKDGKEILNMFNNREHVEQKTNISNIKYETINNAGQLKSDAIGKENRPSDSKDKIQRQN